MVFSITGVGMPLTAFTGQRVAMPDLLQPKSIQLDDDQIYITEQTLVHIYRKTDCHLLKSFGKPGEGPQEFKAKSVRPIIIGIKPDMLVVYSIGKTSYYKKDGTFIKEKRGIGTKTLYELGDNYLAAEIVKGDDSRYEIVYHLYNSRYDKIKEMLRRFCPIQFDKKEWYFFVQMSLTRFYGDCFYLANGNDFEINAFNFVGDNVATIKKNYRREKVTDKHIKAAHEWFQTDSPDKRLYDRFKSWFRFPEYFPAIKNFRVLDNHIYVQTFKRKNNLAEFALFTRKGKYIKTLYLPVTPKNITEDYPYTFKDGKFYHLVDDPEKEEWSLYIMPLTETNKRPVP